MFKFTFCGILPGFTHLNLTSYALSDSKALRHQLANAMERLEPGEGIGVCPEVCPFCYNSRLFFASLSAVEYGAWLNRPWAQEIVLGPSKDTFGD